MKFQQNLTRLRVSSHRLEGECDRWARPERTPLDDRKCKLCHILEGGYHFVLECPLYTDLRKRFIINFIGYGLVRQNLLNYASLRIRLFKKNGLVCSLRKLSGFVQKQYILKRQSLSQIILNYMRYAMHSYE